MQCKNLTLATAFVGALTSVSVEVEISTPLVLESACQYILHACYSPLCISLGLPSVYSPGFILLVRHTEDLKKKGVGTGTLKVRVPKECQPLAVLPCPPLPWSGEEFSLPFLTVSFYDLEQGLFSLESYSSVGWSPQPDTAVTRCPLSKKNKGEGPVLHTGCQTQTLYTGLPQKSPFTMSRVRCRKLGPQLRPGHPAHIGVHRGTFVSGKRRAHNNGRTGVSCCPLLQGLLYQ